MEVNKNSKFFNVILVINPEDVDWTKGLLRYQPASLGTNVSTAEELQLNILFEDYCASVIFSSDEFKTLDPIKLLANIATIVNKNYPDKILRFHIQYSFELVDSRVKISNKTFKLLQRLELGAMKGSSIDPEKINYVKSPSLNECREIVDILNSRQAFATSDIYVGPKPEKKIDKMFTDLYDNKSIFDIMGGSNNGPGNIYEEEEDVYDSDDEDDDDDYFDEDDYDEFESSNVWDNAEERKRMIKRHGLLIARRKDIEKDMEIIEDFIDQFIPDDSRYARQFKEDLLYRWINMYCITKKKLKKKEKEFKNGRKQKAKRIRSSSNNVTKFIDEWYNINK